MKYQFSEKKVDVTDALREYAQKKVGKLEKFFKNECEAVISFSREGAGNVTEVTLFTEGIIFRAKETIEDMYAAIDSSVAAIERQIRKNKTRLEKRLRQGAFDRELPPTVPVPEPDDEEAAFPIIREKRFTLKPMTPEEAILQMNLLGHEFFIFKNFARNANIAVVYKRKDGGYGLIESN